MSKLSEFCIKITDGEHGSVKDDENGSYYFLNNNNITDQGIIISQNDRRISKSDFDRIHKRTQLDYNDIIIATCGTIGKSLVIQDHNINYEFSRSVGIIKCDTNKLLPLYLHYFFENPVTQARIKRISEGGVQKHFYIGAMSDFDIEVPSLEEQKKIVQVLSSLDAKISLNRSIISDLESLSRQIYDYWFVQFDFPDEHGRPYKSSGGKMVWNEKLKRHIPEGWEVKKFTDIINVLGGGTPKTTIKEYWDGDIPFFAPKDIGDSIYIFETEKNITQLGLNNCNSNLYSKDTVIVTARGTVGKVVLTGKNMAMNQSCYALTGKNDIPQYLVFHLVCSIVKKLKTKASGAVFDAIVTRDFETELIALPPSKLIKRFVIKITPIYNNIYSIKQQSIFLTSLRDFLLPMLMNGQVTVNDI